MRTVNAAAAILRIFSFALVALLLPAAAHAATLVAQGRRATLVDRCAAMPTEQLDGWLCYWLGVATVWANLSSSTRSR